MFAVVVANLIGRFEHESSDYKHNHSMSNAKLTPEDA